MAQIQESPLKLELAETDPDADRKAQLADASAARQERLELLVVESNLTEQSDVCSKNLELCIEEAHYVVRQQPLPVTSFVSPIERQLRELRLRMQIWRSDWVVAEGGRSSITKETEPGLYELVSSSMKELNSALLAIHNHINTIWKEGMPSSLGGNIYRYIATRHEEESD
jgi:hypothetical protein